MTIQSNSLVFAGPFLGEFGWELTHWVPHVRWLRRRHYPASHVVVASYPSRQALYRGIANEFWSLPSWFTEKQYDVDCFEALCPQEDYARLLKYFEANYKNRFTEQVITRTPRGFNHVLRENNHVLFERLVPTQIADKECQAIIKEYGNKPIVIMFAREVWRKNFLDIKLNRPVNCNSLKEPLPSRNWPRSYWEKLFEMLYEQYKDTVTFVIGGTSDGNCLAAESQLDDVISLVDADLELSIAFLNKAMLAISSQGGSTQLGLQCGCPSFIYGHEERRHAVIDNPFQTEVTFFKTDINHYGEQPKLLYNDICFTINDLLGRGGGTEREYSPELYETHLDNWVRNADSPKVFAEKFATEWYQRYAKRWQRWFEDIKLNGRLLDLGFGDGKTLYEIGNKYGDDLSIDALDFNPGLKNAIPHLKELVPGASDIWIGDAQDVNKHDGYYDHITAFDFFEHVPEDIYFKILKECHRLLASGGKFYIYFGKPGANHHINCRTANQIVNDMAAHGFIYQSVHGGDMLVFERIEMRSNIHPSHSNEIKSLGMVGVFDVEGSTNIGFAKAFEGI